jgi:hypothetical protein
VRFSVSAVFGSPIGENPEQRHILFLIKGKNAIVEHIGRDQGIPTVI